MDETTVPFPRQTAEYNDFLLRMAEALDQELAPYGKTSYLASELGLDPTILRRAANGTSIPSKKALAALFLRFNRTEFDPRRSPDRHNTRDNKVVAQSTAMSQQEWEKWLQTPEAQSIQQMRDAINTPQTAFKPPVKQRRAAPKTKTPTNPPSREKHPYASLANDLAGVISQIVDAVADQVLADLPTLLQQPSANPPPECPFTADDLTTDQLVALLAGRLTQAMDGDVADRDQLFADCGRQLYDLIQPLTTLTRHPDKREQLISQVERMPSDN